MAAKFPNYTGSITLQEVRLNKGGYTSDGVYFGVGRRLYFVQDYDGDCLPHGDHFRATDRQDAIETAQFKYFPNGKFRY